MDCGLKGASNLWCLLCHLEDLVMSSYVQSFGEDTICVYCGQRRIKGQCGEI